MAKADKPFSRTQAIEDTTIGWRFVNPKMLAMYGTDSMPETAENVAEAYQVGREDQDAYALSSQQRGLCCNVWCWSRSSARGTSSPLKRRLEIVRR
jgi:acetyl-CoA acetyltransferase